MLDYGAMKKNSYLIVGLGNSGSEYEKTRHNAGRDVLEAFRMTNRGSEWTLSSHSKALLASSEVSGVKVTLMLPESLMNNSGRELKREVEAFSRLPEVVLVYDDVDLPLGTLKISFGRSSGGHRGLESIIKQLKTRDFPRLRVGIAPKKNGKVRKPSGEKAVIAFLLKRFTPTEGQVFKKVVKRACGALEMLVKEGYVHAMNEVNRQ
jgi:peptidyl-tRNA hydrolase, PTH1 family